MFNDYPDVLTLAEVCEVLRIGKNQASKILSKGEIQAFKIGGHWKVPKQSIEAYLLTSSKCLNILLR